MITFQNTKNIENLNLKKTIKWLEEIILEENKIQGNIVYLFCDDNYLLEKNIKYLKHDFLTDILTFDYCKKDLISGDILISTERVKENAIKYKSTFLIELKRVIVHGLLHLLAYKDNTTSEKKIMRLKENLYLKKHPDYIECN